MGNRIAEIEARLQAATPGPWVADDREPYDMVVWANSNSDDDTLITNIGSPIAQFDMELPFDRGNCHLIANAPADIRYLLSEVKRLREALDRVQVEGVDYIDIARVALEGKK